MIPFFPRVLLSLFASLFFISAEVRGQDGQTLSRITDPVEESQFTVIKGNVHNMARPMFDRGPAPPSLPMLRMLRRVSVSASGSTTLTITTKAPVALFVPNDRPNGVDRWSTSGKATVAGIFLFVGIFWRRRWGKLLSLATFLLLLTALGCGGGSSSPPPPPPNPGTSPGTYTVTVTATSGSVFHNISLTLNVQ